MPDTLDFNRYTIIDVFKKIPLILPRVLWGDRVGTLRKKLLKFEFTRINFCLSLVKVIPVIDGNSFVFKYVDKECNN